MEESIDSKYEFNAPKYMDFLQGDVDQDADKWFGKLQLDLFYILAFFSTVHGQHSGSLNTIMSFTIHPQSSRRNKSMEIPVL